MNKNLLYYNNREKYKNICIPKREDILNYLIKEKFLSEFSTEEEKERVLNNLGITQKLQLLIQILNEKAFHLELDNYALLSELNKYITLSEFLRRIESIKPKDEKSKGYFSSYNELISEYPISSNKDWAIVNVEGIWYVYRYTEGIGWQLFETYDNSIDLTEYAKLIDLELFLRTLVSGLNIKTINGNSILGEGNIEINGAGNLERYATKEELNNYITKLELFDMQNPLKVVISVSPTLIEYTGDPKIITINAQAKKGETNVEEVLYKISYLNVTNESFNKTYSTSISSKGTITFTVNCKTASEQATGKGTVNIVLPTYFGFDTTNDYNLVDLSKLVKRIKTNILSTEILENQISGSYLWIVSPYNLNTIATDPGYTYKVVMNLEGTKNGLYYYKSNSAIDISNLTYYIK